MTLNGATRITCTTRGILVDLEREQRLLIEVAEAEGQDPFVVLIGFSTVQKRRVEHELRCPTCKRELGVAA
jgi:hypothetical protein